MQTKRDKIRRYLQSNYPELTDPDALRSWVEFLSDEKYSKQANHKLVMTTLGAQATARLAALRKGKTPGFRINPKQLLQRVPEPALVFQDSKRGPLFPILFFRLYLDHLPEYERFHHRFPHYPINDQQMQQLLEEDPFWVEKFRAGSFFTQTPIRIRFPSTLADTHVRLSMRFDSSPTLFTAELRHRDQKVSEIRCDTTDRNAQKTRLDILVFLLTKYDFELPRLVRQIEEEIKNFRHLVPDMVGRFAKYATSDSKRQLILENSRATTSRLLRDGTITSFLYQNFLAWPLTPRTK